ncbi:hypothetical protein CP10139811_0472 [Chlamydia ibidis]|uniref:Uncharacterized protein n=2 Tax=Chlamydia ibidis TaxID=1405396 RepID=S7J2H2_9CHLA|nr:CT847 family type III secretion system effector [Chlamydia ibidis]EPP34624.1 hypothetical protein CP10139811_0472 [Chlamydia ibidis]EQM62298.1 hypothetical protein H359_0850 [Chlamydia ibidis 10-1398/6]
MSGTSKLTIDNQVPTVIPPSTTVVSENITENKSSAIYFCIKVMLQLSVATTEFAKSIMAVLQDNTTEQQKKTKELINLPLLKVPDLKKKTKANEEKEEYSNQTEVQAFQTSNQQITANRQLIQQELSAAQQRAQANQKAVNATSTQSMKLLQAANALLSTLNELTIKANLTTSASN